MGDTCPAGCWQIDGRPFDHVRRCYGPAETVGCVATGTTGFAGYTCRKRTATGVVYRIPMADLPIGDRWSACTEDEEKLVSDLSIPLCGDAGG